ncbi:hypothetical protein MMC09_004311 [Bachmanniomyces sp. S44760]|nr:hypothetical protein [Bachmanniomyces sp. S44760]
MDDPRLLHLSIFDADFSDIETHAEAWKLPPSDDEAENNERNPHRPQATPSTNSPQTFNNMSSPYPHSPLSPLHSAAPSISFPSGSSSFPSGLEEPCSSPSMMAETEEEQEEQEEQDTDTNTTAKVPLAHIKTRDFALTGSPPLQQPRPFTLSRGPSYHEARKCSIDDVKESQPISPSPLSPLPHSNPLQTVSAHAPAPFPIHDITALERRANDHRFLSNSLSLSLSQSKPKSTSRSGSKGERMGRGRSGSADNHIEGGSGSGSDSDDFGLGKTATRAIAARKEEEERERSHRLWEAVVARGPI